MAFFSPRGRQSFFPAEFQSPPYTARGALGRAELIYIRALPAGFAPLLMGIARLRRHAVLVVAPFRVRPDDRSAEAA